MDSVVTKGPNLEKVVRPHVERVQDITEKTSNVVKKRSWLINSIPGAATLLGIASIITLFIYLMLFIFTKYSFGGITRARNIYSSFYLLTSFIIVIVIYKFANPIIDHNTSKSEVPEVVNTTNTDKLITDIFDKINSIVNMAALPFMIIEVLFIVLVVFIVTLMFVITSSLLRTYYAIQCPLDKKIQVEWWGKFVDFFMYCGLIMFFLLYVVFNGVIVGLTSMKQPHSWCTSGLSIVRKFFIITLVYYIVQLLFSGIEYLISNNIIAIHNWRNPPEECSDNQTKETTQSMAKNIENGFYLFLNILLCIFIWLIIIALIAGHIYVSAFLISLDKIISLTDVLFTVPMYLISGNITISGITKVLDSALIKIKSTVPSKILPPQFNTNAKDLAAMAKHEVAKIVSTRPNASPDELISSIATTSLAV
jgi:hypothetical protein